MKFLITLFVFIATIVLNKIFPAFFSKIFDFLFSNNAVCIAVIIFAIIGFITIASIFWKEITSGISDFKSRK